MTESAKLSVESDIKEGTGWHPYDKLASKEESTTHNDGLGAATDLATRKDRVAWKDFEFITTSVH